MANQPTAWQQLINLVGHVDAVDGKVKASGWGKTVMGFQWFGTWSSVPDGLPLLMSEVTGQNGQSEAT